MKARVAVEIFGEEIDGRTVDEITYHVYVAAAARNMQCVLLKLIGRVEVAHGVVFLKIVQQDYFAGVGSPVQHRSVIRVATFDVGAVFQ